jgi:hypothetical protein
VCGGFGVGGAIPRRPNPLRGDAATATADSR